MDDILDDDADPLRASAKTAPAPGTPPLRETRRDAPRWRGPRQRGRDGTAMRSTLLDLDRKGFAMAPSEATAVGAAVFVDLPGIGVRQAAIVRDAGEQVVCAWTKPLSESEYATLLPRTAPVDILTRPPHGFPDPEVTRFPVVIRVGAVGGMALLLWSLIYAARPH